MRVKIKQPGDPRFLSWVPFTRFPPWVPVFDPQPVVCTGQHVLARRLVMQTACPAKAPRFVPAEALSAQERIRGPAAARAAQLERECHRWQRGSSACLSSPAAGSAGSTGSNADGPGAHADAVAHAKLAVRWPRCWFWAGRPPEPHEAGAPATDAAGSTTTH